MTRANIGTRIARGFTLLELMVVVGIIGTLASVAMPEFSRILLRAKAAERPELMQRIKKAVADTYLQKGNINNGVFLRGDWQPALPLAVSKRVPNWKAAGWADIFKAEEIEGAVYYSYAFEADDSQNPPTLSIFVQGDLDGDGVVSVKFMNFERREGSYVLTLEWPEPGAEDFLTF